MRSDEYDYLIAECHQEIVTQIEHFFNLTASRSLWEQQNQVELPDLKEKTIDFYVSELGLEDGLPIAAAILGVPNDD